MTSLAEYERSRKVMASAMGPEQAIELIVRRTGRTTEMLLKVLLHKGDSMVLTPHSEWSRTTMRTLIDILSYLGVPFECSHLQMQVRFRGFGPSGTDNLIQFTSNEALKRRKITPQEARMTRFYDQK